MGLGEVLRSGPRQEASLSHWIGQGQSWNALASRSGALVRVQLYSNSDTHTQDMSFESVQDAAAHFQHGARWLPSEG